MTDVTCEAGHAHSFVAPGFTSYCWSSWSFPVHMSAFFYHWNSPGSIDVHTRSIFNTDNRTESITNVHTRVYFQHWQLTRDINQCSYPDPCFKPSQHWLNSTLKLYTNTSQELNNSVHIQRGSPYCTCMLHQRVTFRILRNTYKLFCYILLRLPGIRRRTQH